MHINLTMCSSESKELHAYIQICTQRSWKSSLKMLIIEDNKILHQN